ncbi:hypothetical protein [Halioxenophilus aromaticivorans]|uniref:Uncharacterized protein n=1 Tax=Halioxenophilus aromaticivorans TaxID=1306992 RepID=A0AAV3U0C3_9ALTE
MKPTFVCLLCLALAGPVSLGSASEVKKVSIGPAAGIAQPAVEQMETLHVDQPVLQHAVKPKVTNNHIKLDRGLTQGLGFGFNLVL